MTETDTDYLHLHSPIALGENWQRIWYDPAHNHCVLFNDGYFYILWLDDEYSSPKLHFHRSDLVGDIILGRVSLDKELLAVQLSLTTLLVIDIISRKSWSIEVRCPADTMILNGGIIWSDHAGNSQDLILVTNKGLEFFKISTKKNQCKQCRVINQNAFAFWYNSHHRLILLASYNKASRFSKTKKDVLIMDGYFLRTDKALLPTLELPPPDHIPRFELGPGVSSDSIYLVSVYGRLLTLVHYSTGKEDFLTVYHLTKSSVERLYCLSLQGVVNGLKISTHDNLVLCHNLPNKSSLIFDLMNPAKTKQSPASIEQVDSITNYSPVFRYVEVLDENSPLELNKSPEEDWNTVEPVLAVAADLQDFDTLRFAEDSLNKHRTSLSSYSLKTKTRKFSQPKQVYTFYFSVIFDILSEGFALDKESHVIWRIGCNLVEVSKRFKTVKEALKFMSRRGRVYRLPCQEDSFRNLIDEKTAKYSILKFFFDLISKQTVNSSNILEYLEALLPSYTNEFSRLSFQEDNFGRTEMATLISKSVLAMDLAQSVSRTSSSSTNEMTKPTIARRTSLGELFNRSASLRLRNESNGTLELYVRQCSDTLEPIGISSALFSDITNIGNQVKAWCKCNTFSRIEYDAKANATKLEGRHSTRSIKSVHDHSVLHLRRDENGSLIVSHIEIVGLVLVPFLSRCSGNQYESWILMLGEYLSKIAEENIPRTPSLCVLHAILVYNMRQFDILTEYLNMRLYSDCVELAFMLLQFADLLDEAEIDSVSAAHYRRIFSDEGVKMLWRLNEKIAVVKWYLSKGRVEDAIDVCRQYGGSDSELSARHVNGLEFFATVVKEVEANAANAVDLLYSVYLFIQFWDPSAIGGAGSKGNSQAKLRSITPFPKFVGVTREAEQELKRLFGYDI